MYEKIKKRNGEKFAKQIRAYDSGICDIPDIDKIVRYAGADAEALMQYLISLKNVKIIERPSSPLSPFNLLAQAGYDAFVADTLEKQNSIRPYFAKGEELCTFGDEDRFQNYYIVHAVRKDVDSIRRESFPHPRREDDYGTSVISIQMAKMGGFISIKNRYNHMVNNPDNTFGSNPDNIIEGLSNALRSEFNVDFSSQTSDLSDGYAVVNGHIVRQNYEIDGNIFGDDAYTKYGRLIEVDKGKGEWLFDHYVYSDRTKTMTAIADNDSFAKDFNRTYGGRKTLCVKDHCLYDGDTLLIGTKDKGSAISSLHLAELTAAGEGFFRFNTDATVIDLPSLAEARDNFCTFNRSATELNFPLLTKAGHFFCSSNTKAKVLNLPSLLEAGEHFCHSVNKAVRQGLPPFRPLRMPHLFRLE